MDLPVDTSNNSSISFLVMTFSQDKTENAYVLQIGKCEIYYLYNLLNIRLVSSYELRKCIIYKFLCELFTKKCINLHIFVSQLNHDQLKQLSLKSLKHTYIWSTFYNYRGLG